jgi:hypothetical protein
MKCQPLISVCSFCGHNHLSTANSLVGGSNIGESLKKGLDAAWKQILAGAAIGGVSAGISALKYDRTF